MASKKMSKPDTSRKFNDRSPTLAERRGPAPGKTYGPPAPKTDDGMGSRRRNRSSTSGGLNSFGVPGQPI